MIDIRKVPYSKNSNDNGHNNSNDNGHEDTYLELSIKPPK